MIINGVECTDLCKMPGWYCIYVNYEKVDVNFNTLATCYHKEIENKSYGNCNDKDCPLNKKNITLVICDKVQDGCEGCRHAEEHEPYIMKNGNKCGMDGFCDIHCIDVVCKKVLKGE